MWKDVPGFEDLYKVSDLGLVISKRTGKLVTGDTNNAGYYRVTFYKGDGTHKRVFRHRLVAELFVDNPNPEKFNIVNHKNHAKEDCCARNLEWCDFEYNQYDMFKNRESCVPIKIVFDNGEEKTYDFANQAARDLGVTGATIRNWANGMYNTGKQFGIKSIKYINKPNDYRNGCPIYFLDNNKVE